MASLFGLIAVKGLFFYEISSYLELLGTSLLDLLLVVYFTWALLKDSHTDRFHWKTISVPLVGLFAVLLLGIARHAQATGLTPFNDSGTMRVAKLLLGHFAGIAVLCGPLIGWRVQQMQSRSA